MQFFMIKTVISKNNRLHEWISWYADLLAFGRYYGGYRCGSTVDLFDDTSYYKILMIA